VTFLFRKNKMKQDLVRPDINEQAEPIPAFTEVKEKDEQEPTPKPTETPKEIEEIIDSRLDAKVIEYKPVAEETNKESETKTILAEQTKSFQRSPNAEKKTYIDSIMDNNKAVLDDAETELQSLQKAISSSKKVLTVLETIKRRPVSIDVDWVINQIGEILKNSNIKTTDKMEHLRDDIIDFVEEQLRQQKKIK